MKKFLSIFLPSLLVVACFLYVFPLNSLADTILDSNICWSLDRPGTYSNLITYSDRSTYYSQIYDYTSSSNWAQVGTAENTTRLFQLPSPYSSTSSVQITQTKNSAVYTNNSGGLSTIGFGFNEDIFTIFDSLSPSLDDYVCFAVFMSLEQPISQVKFTLGELVTGSSYQDSGIHIDDRYIQKDPNNINGGTSAVIDPTLWADPSSSRYFVVFYWNVLYSDLKSIQNIGNGNSKAFILSFKTPTRSRALICDPILYKASSNFEDVSIQILNSINDNVQIISDVVQQGSYTTPPSSSDVDFSSVNSLDQAVADFNNNSVVWNDLGTGFNGIEITSGLAWVGVYIASYYGRIPFLSSIFAVIIFFKIAQLLTASPYNKIYRNEIHNTEIHNEIKQARLEEHAQTHGEASINDFYGH